MKKEPNPGTGTAKKPPPISFAKEMNEAKVKKILKDVKFKEDGSLSDDLKYLSWNVGQIEVTLDGDFTAEELHAIAWWIRHKNAKPTPEKKLEIKDEPRRMD